ncbi:MAG: Hsp20/alpha crystallin family protein [Syntrophobacteraceae bacterium]
MAEGAKNSFIEELKAMKERMEELFLRNFDVKAGEAEPETPSEVWTPRADIIDTGKELIYTLDLPGVLEQDLEVECGADVLRVSGSRREDSPEGKALGTERPRGPFSRIFKLPCPIRPDAIQAELKKGVLRLVVPRECTTDSGAQKVFVRRDD